MFFDRIKYTATKVDDSTFSISLVTGFEELPTTATRVSLYAIDSANNYVHFDGKRTGSTLVVNFIYDSSEINNTMPTFTSGLVVYSTAGAEILKNQNVGIAGVMVIGQSNAIGTDLSSKDSVIDYSDSRILEWRNDGFYDTLSIASDPLQHQSTPRADSVGWGMTFAKDLIKKEGYNKVCLLASAHGGTGFGSNDWNQGDGLYSGAVAKANAFLADDPNNHIVGIIWGIGEDDSWGDIPGSAAAFASAYDAACAAIRTDLVGNTRQSDFSRVPILCTGMTDDWVALGGDKVIVQTALEEVTQRQAYSGFVSAVGATTQAPTEVYHFDTTGIRLLGARIHDEWLNAKGLTSAIGTGATGSVNVTLGEFMSSATGNIDIPIVGTVNTTLGDFISTSTGSVSTAVTGTVSETLGDFTVVASGGVNIPTAESEWIPNTGITEDANGVSQWDDQIGANNATQTVNAEKPNTDASGNIVFDRANVEHLDIAASLFNNPTGHTIIARINTSGLEPAGSGNMNICSAFQDAFYIQGSDGTLRSFAGRDFGNIATSTATLDDGVDHDIAVSLDGSGGIQLYIDGSADGSATSTAGKVLTNVDGRIGAFQSGASTINSFNGTIKRVALYHDVLTGTEINDITAGW